jgi:hypothetical protein
MKFPSSPCWPRASSTSFHALAAMLALAWGPSAMAQDTWPAIRSLSVTIPVTIRADGAAQRIEQAIVAPSGTVLYEFRCRAGTTAQLDALGDAEGENYVAPLVCALGQAGEPGLGALLAEDDVALHATRGQVRAEELEGACGRYPEFGRVRHFRLRGMRLTLIFSRVVAEREGNFLRTSMQLRAEPDPGAHLSQAERPGYLPPEADCRRVRKGVETRMCRDESFSFTECANLQR